MDILLKGIECLPGIGPKKKELLKKLGLCTVWDVLFHVPLRYEDRAALVPLANLADGEKAAVLVRAVGQMRVVRKNGKQLFLQTFSDGTGLLSVTWQNTPFITRTIRMGGTYTLYGRITMRGERRQMFAPLFVPAGHSSPLLGRIIPIYPACASVSQSLLLQVTEGALSLLCGNLPDVIPPDIRKKAGIYPIEKALLALHRPESMAEAQNGLNRLKFQEFFFLSIGMHMQKKQLSSEKGLRLSVPMEPFFSALPFAPTDGQARAIADICRDMACGRPMNRLIEGDVGSGKTVVAAAALYIAAACGKQGLLMAPTEILARQHAASLRSLLPGISVCLFTGKLRAAERREAEAAIREGRAGVIVGTQALLNENLPYSRVAVAIADEQHRFGVRQRGFLSALSPAPHMLVMSATPIPRTLSLTYYNDLDISILPARPKGRMPVDTFVVPPTYRERIYAFLRKTLSAGGRAYILCPLAEESEGSDLCDVLSYAASLSPYFAPDEILTLHGKMKNKDEIMEKFSTGGPKILVSTTVVEVGVDVPSATVMVIENAERFGLSQLHQLRGRVGRGTEKSYCILVSEPKTPTARERLSTLRQEFDGFKIAEADLRLRGAGEFFGTRQHGEGHLLYGDIIEDAPLLAGAAESAKTLLSADPTLSHHPEILASVRSLYRRFAMN